MLQLSTSGFKEMSKTLKIYPVVVTEETIDKVIVFCAKKLTATEANQQP